VWKAAHPDWREIEKRQRGKQQHSRFKTRLKSNFDMTFEEYEVKAAKQGNKCAICGRVETATSVTGAVKALAVDHCHLTKTNRGLLCQQCNLLLGNCGDSVEILEKAIAYLKWWAEHGK
jgi:hypothetical protein